MSRGFGVAQRFILDVLAEQPGRWFSAWDLAEARMGRNPTRVEVQAMRNAMRRLEALPDVDVWVRQEYWGILGQLQDAGWNHRPKRVFPTLVIGRNASRREHPHEGDLRPPKIAGADDPGF